MSELGFEDDYFDGGGTGAWEQPHAVSSSKDKEKDTAGTPSMKHEDDGTKTLATHSGVDGVGMWKSWTHNYEDPKFACLDLLDNCFDATLSVNSSKSSNFEGKISMSYLAPNGIVILNNSSKPIKSLEETLTAYRSAKNKDTSAGKAAAGTPTGAAEDIKKDAIGEYGVGLKQACATLSNVSFVLTKNHHQFQLGVIAEALQTTHSVSLPHFDFEIDPYSDTDVQEQIHMSLQRITREYPNIFHLLTNTLGKGNKHQGVQALVDQCEFLYEDPEWSCHPHLFQLIITNFNHTSHEAARTSDGIRQHPARTFLEDIRQLLPKHYINIPQKNFQFTIEDEPVRFTFWQHRLVEMTKFQVFIHKEKPVNAVQNFASEGYPLSIYCGFDAIRLLDRNNNQAKTCQLNIYSRQSGRLIETTDDARDLLGMGVSGVDYSQGLTIILDDVAGELPLKPTKDGLTWSKEACGEIHKSNLLAWTGAVGRFYWKYHHDKFKLCASDSKKKMGEAIKSFVEAMEARIQQYQNSETIDPNDPTNERLENAEFTEFADVKWLPHVNSNTRKVTIRTMKTTKKVDVWPKPATVWKFNESHYPASPNATELTTPTPNKRKSWRESSTTPAAASTASKRKVQRTSVSSTASKPPPAGNDDDSSSGEEEEELVAEIPSPAVLPKKLAFASPQAVRELSRDRKAAAARKKVPRKPSFQRTIDEEADAPKTKELEQSLQASQAEVERLRGELNQARRQLMNPTISTREQTLEKALQQAQQETEQVRKENTQLQQSLQEHQKAQQSMQLVWQENAQLKQQQQQWERDQQRIENLQQSLQSVMQENGRLKLETERLEQGLLYVQQERHESNSQELQHAQEQIKQLRLQVDQLQQNQQQAGSNLQQSLEAAQREKLELQQRNMQLEQQLRHQGPAEIDLRQKNALLARKLKEAEECRSREISRMKSEIDGLKLDLEKRQNTISRLNGTGGGFSWGGGIDQI